MTTVMLALKPEANSEQLIDLVLAHVDLPATVEAVALVRIHADGDELELLAQTEEVLKAKTTRLAEAGFEVRLRVSVAIAGSEGLALAHHAESIGADLAVIGLGHKSRVGKAIMGSEAQRLIIALNCPILARRLEEA